MTKNTPFAFEQKHLLRTLNHCEYQSHKPIFDPSTGEIQDIKTTWHKYDIKFTIAFDRFIKKYNGDSRLKVVHDDSFILPFTEVMSYESMYDYFTHFARNWGIRHFIPFADDEFGGLIGFFVNDGKLDDIVLFDMDERDILFKVAGTFTEFLRLFKHDPDINLEEVTHACQLFRKADAFVRSEVPCPCCGSFDH